MNTALQAPRLEAADRRLTIGQWLDIVLASDRRSPWACTSARSATLTLNLRPVYFGAIPVGAVLLGSQHRVRPGPAAALGDSPGGDQVSLPPVPAAL